MVHTILELVQCRYSGCLPILLGFLGAFHRFMVFPVKVFEGKWRLFTLTMSPLAGFSLVERVSWDVVLDCLMGFYLCGWFL